MVKIPKRGGRLTFWKNSQIITYSFWVLTLLEMRCVSWLELCEFTFFCIATGAVILPWMVTQLLVWRIECRENCVNSTCKETHACKNGFLCRFIIAFNGFQWPRKIGRTMEWSQCIAMDRSALSCLIAVAVRRWPEWKSTREINKDWWLGWGGGGEPILLLGIGALSTLGCNILSYPMSHPDPSFISSVNTVSTVSTVSAVNSFHSVISVNSVSTVSTVSQSTQSTQSTLSTQSTQSTKSTQSTQSTQSTHSVNTVNSVYSVNSVNFSVSTVSTFSQSKYLTELKCEIFQDSSLSLYSLYSLYKWT